MRRVEHGPNESLEGDQPLAAWRREALRRFAGAALRGEPRARERWREAATAKGCAAERMLRRQRLWIELAGPRVPRRILEQPAPRLFRVGDVPAGERENAQWYRVASIAAEQARRGQLEPHVAERVLGLVSSQAPGLYRGLGGVRGIRRGLAAFVGWCSAHPARLAAADGREPCEAFLGWLEDLRARPGLRLPSGREPLDWLGLALPRDAALFAIEKTELAAADARATALATVDRALAWLEQMHGEGALLTEASFGMTLLFAFVSPEGSHTLVLSDSYEPRGWEIEQLAGPDGEPATPEARRKAELWLAHERGRLPPAAFAPFERDTN